MNATAASGEVEKIWKVAESVGIAMLTTHGEGEEMVARPMYSIIPDGEGVVWFITDRRSAKVGEATKGARALLTYSGGRHGDHLVMRGRVAMVDDRAKLKALWVAGDDLFFPKGPTDDSAVLLRFDPESGEYWSGGPGVVGFTLNFLAAKFTGERRKVGEHKVVDL